MPSDVAELEQMEQSSTQHEGNQSFEKKKYRAITMTISEIFSAIIKVLQSFILV